MISHLNSFIQPHTATAERGRVIHFDDARARGDNDDDDVPGGVLVFPCRPVPVPVPRSATTSAAARAAVPTRDGRDVEARRRRKRRGCEEGRTGAGVRDAGFE